MTGAVTRSKGWVSSLALAVSPARSLGLSELWLSFPISLENAFPFPRRIPSLPFPPNLVPPLALLASSPLIVLESEYESESESESDSESSPPSL